MSQKTDITDLTICRSAFAAWVFLYHLDLHLHFSAWLGPLSGLIRHGYLGVDGFFILSGLILMHTHREFHVPKMDWIKPELTWPAPKAIFSFYAKRLARIYPVHLATLLILLALLAGGAALGLTPYTPKSFGMTTLVQNLFLVQGWGGDHFGAWNYPSWSISTEWAGYLLFPLFATLLSYFIREVSIQLAVLLWPVLGLIYYISGNTLNLTFSAGLIRFFPEFLLGIASFRVTTIVSDFEFARQLFFWAGLGLTFLGAALSVDVLAVLGLWGVLFALYLQADSEKPPVFGRRPVLHFLGLLSYCFYMSFATAEMLTVQGFRHFGWQPTTHGWLFAACMTGSTFALAMLLRVLVEQPCRKLANRWLTPQDAVKQVARATEKPQSLF
ncbi:acyltransferase family protein [Acidocella aminolytica]|uniref:Acyltransferase n=1 Tax=Acidocella aminolytica 101 = DSM 11237 TaxID=1120923 RepID=A0A0D6PFU2_9PROT|nr:acyltransferase [Acidocella aminolytica]GAN79709.1 acyltransferase [Acidocella aminolytica 101 = DSM 11237]GBQ39807.1 acyltransferase 3 [Acidocella aminolytica 101 = DSM 11237]SHE73498.1 Peptidoglycan/LPS O-acetylase OafA/YrhL, contains acyltransferase and SGNH-hydrolase domains [Acidocella aminolytica 101 = DSM 11237]